MTEESELKQAIRSAWFAVNNDPSLKLLSGDTNGVLFNDRQHGLVGWVVKYYEPYDESTRKYADRKAVGFCIGYKPYITQLCRGFQTGLDHIITHFEEIATQFEEGGKLPEPKVCLIWY